MLALTMALIDNDDDKDYKAEYFAVVAPVTDGQVEVDVFTDKSVFERLYVESSEYFKVTPTPYDGTRRIDFNCYQSTDDSGVPDELYHFGTAVEYNDCILVFRFDRPNKDCLLSGEQAAKPLCGIISALL